MSNSPLSPDLNRAFLNSLRPGSVVPVQTTTTTFAPVVTTNNNIPVIPPLGSTVVSAPSNRTTPSVPIINRNTQMPPSLPSLVRTVPSVPIINTNVQTPHSTLPPVPTSPIPIYPTIKIPSTPNRFGLPSAPSNTTTTTRSRLPPIPKLEINNRPSSPRITSPRRMTESEEEQLQRAIRISLQDQYNYQLSPREFVNQEVDEDLEQALIDAAIAESLQAANSARIAANSVRKIASPPVSPRTVTRREIQAAYEESVRMDQEKAMKEAAEAAEKAAEAAERAAKLLKEVKEKETLTAPNLLYPITDNMNEIYNLRFRLPDGSVVNHMFNRNEPIKSVLQQLRFDTKHTGEFVLIVPPRTPITCHNDTPLSECGLSNRMLVQVTTI